MTVRNITAWRIMNRHTEPLPLAHELATFQQLTHLQIPNPKDAQKVHRITGAMVRGQSMIEHPLDHFIEFLSAPDTFFLAHHVAVDLGFLAMAVAQLGIAFPLHDLFDILDRARWLYPTWLSHSLETVATRLNVANGAEHRALSDARLVKEIFLAVLQRAATIRAITDLRRLSPSLTFANAPVCAIEPSPGFQALAMAVAARCVITIVYEGGAQRPGPRRIRPRAVL